MASGGQRLRASGDAFLRELGFREYSHYVLFHFPRTNTRSYDERFERFPWRGRPGPLLEAWKKGLTGVPLVDAGMRQLWHIGWMHNRVRMIAASFLVKNCGVLWLEGARWFWDTLCDADLANNTFNGQWVAGCGVDPAPFFRVFNPVSQSQRFDADGRYIKTWIPELRNVPIPWLFQPWRVPAKALGSAGLDRESVYRKPLIDLALGRRKALEGYASIKTYRRQEIPPSSTGNKTT